MSALDTTMDQGDEWPADEPGVASGELVRREVWLTVERATYIAAGLLAAVVRLAGLGLRPLADGEAGQALTAFQFSHGTIGAAPAGTVPALFTANVMGFTLFGSSDAMARWLPALAGIALAVLPYWLRGRLGRGGALAASVLLALSPAAVYFSRSVDGAMVAAAAGLAVVVGLLHYVDTRRPGGLYVAAGALGLGLTASPAMVTLVLILLVYGFWQWATARWLGQAEGWQALSDAWRQARAEPGLVARAGVVLAAVFGLMATTLVLHPAGIGLTADLLASWARGFLPEPNGQWAFYPLLLLLRYEPIVLILGAAEAVRWAISRRGQDAYAHAGDARLAHTGLLAFWAGAALLLVMVAGHRPPGNVLLIVVPLALLAGQGIARAARWIAGRVPWAQAALVGGAAILIVAFLYLQLAGYSLWSNNSMVTILGADLLVSTGHLLLALLALVLLVGLGIVAGYVRGPAVAAAGLWLALVVVLAAFGVKAAAEVNFVHPADAREILNVEPAAPEVRLLRAEVEKLSETLTADKHALPITVERGTGPAVAWALREFRHQTVVDSLANQPAPEELQAAITLATQDLPIGETFRGEAFPVRTAWQPYSLNAQAWVRWFMFGEAWLPAVDRQVVLWAARPAGQ